MKNSKLQKKSIAYTDGTIGHNQHSTMLACIKEVKQMTDRSTVKGVALMVEDKCIDIVPIGGL